MAAHNHLGGEPDDPGREAAGRYAAMLAIEREVVAPAAEARLDLARVRALGAELGRRSVAFAAEHGDQPEWVLKQALELAERAIFGALQDAAERELPGGRPETS
jgi:anaerobic selenocysteine-containing dehydrogenase